MVNWYNHMGPLPLFRIKQMLGFNVIFCLRFCVRPNLAGHGQAAQARGRTPFVHNVSPCSPTGSHVPAALQRKIVARMRSLGMTPVFPAFNGLVPDALVASQPQVVPPCCNPSPPVPVLRPSRWQ